MCVCVTSNTLGGRACETHVHVHVSLPSRTHTTKLSVQKLSLTYNKSLTVKTSQVSACASFSLVIWPTCPCMNNFGDFPTTASWSLAPTLRACRLLVFLSAMRERGVLWQGHPAMRAVQLGCPPTGIMIDAPRYTSILVSPCLLGSCLRTFAASFQLTPCIARREAR
jgi:hypothetical protein